MPITLKSGFYRSAATRIVSQRVALAKILAAQKHAPAMQRRRRTTDAALLRNILNMSESLMIELATAKDSDWRDVKDRLSDYLERFDALANSKRLHVPGPARTATAPKSGSALEKRTSIL
jgi:hypothetical protein